jgi:hypothetical protein
VVHISREKELRMATTTYRATYGNKPCRFILTHGNNYGTVLLDRDPGYGSMYFGRIHVSQVDLGEELPDRVLPERAQS